MGPLEFFFHAGGYFLLFVMVVVGLWLLIKFLRTINIEVVDNEDWDDDLDRQLEEFDDELDRRLDELDDEYDRHVDELDDEIDRRFEELDDHFRNFGDLEDIFFKDREDFPPEPEEFGLNDDGTVDPEIGDPEAIRLTVVSGVGSGAPIKIIFPDDDEEFSSTVKSVLRARDGKYHVRVNDLSAIAREHSIGNPQAPLEYDPKSREWQWGSLHVIVIIPGWME